MNVEHPLNKNKIEGFKVEKWVFDNDSMASEFSLPLFVCQPDIPVKHCHVREDLSRSF